MSSPEKTLDPKALASLARPVAWGVVAVGVINAGPNVSAGGKVVLLLLTSKDADGVRGCAKVAVGSLGPG